MGYPVKRPRRLRINDTLRSITREYRLSAEQLIYPLFVVEGLNEPREISAMPGQYHWPVEQICEPIASAMKNGIKSFILFGVPQDRDEYGSSAWNPDSIVAQAIKLIKANLPEAYIITDVCLCAYTSHGHCGIPSDSGVIQNDISLEYLSKMALAHAKAGADMVAPSDMMDGRISAIRTKLDENGFENTPIMSYSAKYASSFYGPFREAAGSAPGKGNRKSYQMDYSNSREAIVEMELDIEEGADILMVKPGLPYLDIIAMAKNRFNCPIAAYQVSGEYSMIKAGAEKGWIDEKSVVLESLTSIYRAGAGLILTYFAPDVGKWLKEEEL